MSYAAVKAIGCYAGPEATCDDPIQIHIGIASDPQVHTANLHQVLQLDYTPTGVC